MRVNNYYEIEYKNLLKSILVHGVENKTRDDNIRISLFGESLEFNNVLGLFPMLTSKKMFFKNVKYELSWILKGITNIEYLKQNNVSIWNLWADKNGELGDTYGKLLRSFNGIDQLKVILNELETNKNSSRLVISLWNPVAIQQGNIRPCYHAFQLVPINRYLHINISQRSADAFVGLPYDMAVFSLLLRLIADKYDFIPGKVKINIGNLHVYKEHVEPVNKYLKNDILDLPSLYNGQREVLNFEVKKVKLKNYESNDFIKAKIIV
jgi:thymidylate synthase